MLSLWLATLLAQAPKLAAPPWTAVDVPADKAAFFATHFASALRDRGVGVITAEDIAVLIGAERQRQLLGCSTDTSSCMVELGAALGAELLLVGSIARLDSTFVVSLRVAKSSDGKVVAQEQARASGQEALLDALTGAASSLASQLNPAAPSRRPSPFIVPAVIAGVTAAAGAVLLVLALVTSGELDRALVPGANREAVNAIGSRGQTLEAAGWICVGVGIASGATAVALRLFERPAPVSVALLPQGALVQWGGPW